MFDEHLLYDHPRENNYFDSYTATNRTFVVFGSLTTCHRFLSVKRSFSNEFAFYDTRGFFTKQFSKHGMKTISSVEENGLFYNLIVDCGRCSFFRVRSVFQRILSKISSENFRYDGRIRRMRKLVNRDVRNFFARYWDD